MSIGSGGRLIAGVASKFFDPTDSNENWPERKLNAFLWSGQREIRASVRRNRYTAVHACHGVGKDWSAAEAAVEHIDTHDLGDAFVCSTAPTSSQVTAILWRYIERMHRKGNLPGRISIGRIPEWKLGMQLIGFGRHPSDYNKEAFQGIHETYILIIVDEAEGIPKILWDAIYALMTNENARVLAIGNPPIGDTQSEFKRICQPGSGWNVIHIDGLLTPNFTELEVKRASNKVTEGGKTGDLYQYMVDNAIPFATEKIPYDLQVELLSPLWVAERMPQWGIYKKDDGSWRSEPLWDAKVRGNFSDQTVNGMIPGAWIEMAVQRWKAWDASGRPVDQLTGGRAFAIDVAGEGEDETVVGERVGHAVVDIDRSGYGTDTLTPAIRVGERINQRGGRVTVDYNGLGKGTGDQLIKDGHSVIRFVGQQRTDATDRSGEFRFANIRTAAYWNLRELLVPGSGANILLPPDPFMIADLKALQYRVATGAVIHAEEKAQVHRRLGRSPDTGDMVSMLFWLAGLGYEGEPYTTDYGGESELVSRYVPSGDAEVYVASSSVFEEVYSEYASAGWE